MIKINKRFFLHNAGNNTMLKVDTMVNIRLIFGLDMYGKLLSFFETALSLICQ